MSSSTRDIAACDPLADFELGELDIEAEEVAALPRDDQHAAIMGGLDQALAANVREIGDASTSITPQAWLAESP